MSLKVHPLLRPQICPEGRGEAFDGVTVQLMVMGKGYELIVGSSVDAQLGPVMLFGSGGVLVEVFKDRALALPPLTRTLARRMMERTKIFTSLQGVRGQQAVDLAELETLLVRFSLLLADFPEIREVDINPLLATPERIVALDARVLLGSGADARLALPPYPSQDTAPFRLRDGREVSVRTIKPEDERLIIALHESHSEHTIRMRFFSLVKTLSRDSLIRLCHLDYNREMALVAVEGDGKRAKIAGVARYYLHPESGSAEFAVVVGDAWQGQGLGSHLMVRLIGVARERGVRKLVGLVLVDNNEMLRLMSKMGFVTEKEADGVVTVAMSLG